MRLLLIVGGPLIFFCGLEGALRLTGFGKPTDFFIPDEKAGVYRTNPDFTHPFIPAQFDIEPLNFRLSRHKNPDTVRIFVFGESAAQGLPEPGFGFAAQLQVQLQARYPDKKIEVCNLGVTAIDSHVVYQIAREAVKFEPDLFVIYMGNNEVVGPYGPGCAYLAKTPPLWMIRAGVWARRTRTGQLLADLLGKLARNKQAMEWKGMETFSENTVRADDPRLEEVYRNFAANLKDIVGLAAHAGIKTVLSTVVANLKDCAPFVSLHRTGLSAEDLKTWKSAFEEGMLAWNLGEAEKARSCFNAALKIDSEYAGTYYMLGKLAGSHGEPELARQNYLNALHWDALRFRPDSRINDIIRKVAKEGGAKVDLVDAAGELGSDPASTGSISGHEILFEHVHFNWEGNFQLARLLVEKCAVSGDSSSGRWLSAPECADALGYTDFGRLNMLLVMASMTGRPPFTNQLTFDEDQARLKRDIELTKGQLDSPDILDATEKKMNAALQRDPENSRLAMQLEIFEYETDNFERASQLLDQVDALQPPTPALVNNRAEVLMGLHHYDKAEDLLLKFAGSDASAFQASCDTLVEVWAKTGQFDKGLRYFEDVLKKNPSNRQIRLEYGDLFARQGDGQNAEKQWRLILQDDPGNEAALEALVDLLQQERNPEAAAEISIEMQSSQAKNYKNNTRLAEIFMAKNDREKTLEFMQAMAASGPASAALHLELARRLHDLNRDREALIHAAAARKIAEAEGDREKLPAIAGLIRLYGGK
jgi:tetratricopeptide (TPR) repeat protein